MAVPFRRKGKTAKRKRRTHYKLRKPTLVVDKQTGDLILPHRVSPFTGEYKGRVVVKEDKTREE
ncbi:MAG: 50S ribosomal protein L32 [Acholeplasmataceae bacterium]|jgi:large subunit ribosomal protein L32|nr:50S ribosomal protein L32 [Acholeplasmataceae bacterium]